MGGIGGLVPPGIPPRRIRLSALTFSNAKRNFPSRMFIYRGEWQDNSDYFTFPIIHHRGCRLGLFTLRAVSLFFNARANLERRRRETRETRAAARGHLRVSGVLLDGPRKKRDCS